MRAEPNSPFIVKLCQAIVRSAALLVPSERRRDWEQEWHAEIWHHWGLFRDAGEWNWREALRLLRSSLGSIIDAVSYFALQEPVQQRAREIGRSPWTSLGGLTVVLILIGFLSGGFPATRELLRPLYKRDTDRLFTLSLRGFGGHGEVGLDPTVIPVWEKDKKLVDSLAPFTFLKEKSANKAADRKRPLIVKTEPRLFHVMESRFAAGGLPSTKAGVVLDDRAWKTLFSRNPRAVGSQIELLHKSYPISGVLADNAHFLSRRGTAFLVVPKLTYPDHVVVLARAKPGVTEDMLERTFTRLAEKESFFFVTTRLRAASLTSTAVAPVWLFAIIVAAAALLVIFVSRVRVRRWRTSWRPEARKATWRRIGFFVGKVVLALVAVFTAGLEATRSNNALLLRWEDGANGPTLIWFYVAMSMAALFWAVADQRARCRTCLRLLCSPVRMGCPGYMLLEWAGTEFLCSEGHGVLHVPHLTPTWDDQAERWISMDESWHDLFVHH